MRTESEKDWILDAVDAVSTCFIVLSPEYEILAANRPAGSSNQEKIIGRKCHDAMSVISSKAGPRMSSGGSDGCGSSGTYSGNTVSR